jgi:putative peptidoglycan lipid II flippase
MDAYREGVTSGTTKIIFLMIPFMMYLMVFASPLITMLAAGKFSDADIAMTASYLRALAASLPVYGVCMYLQKVCSSLRRMGLFAVANVVAAGIQVAICIFATPLFGLDMVAYSSAFFFLAVDIVTFASLRSTLKRVGLGSITASIVRAALFGLAGAVAGAGVLILLSRVIGPIGQSISRAFIFTVAGGIPSVIVTFGIALVTHSPETDVVRNLVGRLLRRR